jgi:hypothetical protein
MNRWIRFVGEMFVVAGLCAGAAHGEANASGGAALYAGVASAVKSALAHADALAAMKRAFQALRLMDDAGEFTLPALRGKGLLDAVDGAAFVDQVVGCAASNPYLTAFMAAARGRSFKVEGQGDAATVLASAAGYAMVLDRLTRLVRGDSTVLRALRDHWVKRRKGFEKVFNTFEVAKTLSVDMVIRIYLKNFKTKKVPHDDGRVGLPVNILEAALEDLRLGYRENARAGFLLSLHPPGEKRPNARTGAGPTGFSADGRAITYAPPLPRKWADLYSTWNMAFVSHYPNFPFFLAKLLAPQVLCYEKEPNQYMYNRVVALYAHIHYEAFTRLDRKARKPGTELIRWADADLTRLWSRVNLTSAKAYDAAVEKLEPTLWGSARKRTEAIWNLLVKSAGTLKRGLFAFLEKRILSKVQSLFAKLRRAKK